MPNPTVVKAIVELVGMGKRLDFKVEQSNNPKELPPGSSFSSPAYLWKAAYAGTHPKVFMKIENNKRIFFHGVFKQSRPGGSYATYWGPAR